MNVNKELIAGASIQVLKPIDEVFEAIVDPSKLSKYFISKSTGRMEEGKELIWHFPEFEEACPVRINKILPNQFISFFWEVNDREHLAEIHLSSTKNKHTLVKVEEKGGKLNEKGIQWLKGNTEGWANFLACLKAYLEYGINLRKGAYDYLKK